MTASDQAETLNDSPATPNTERPAPSAASEKETVPSTGGNEATSASSAAQDPIAAAKKEAADNYDKYVRTVADMENLRRRFVREKDELRQYAAGRVLEDLLPILDNFSLGLSAAKAPNADLKNLVGGISMVQEQLKTALSNHGLKEINPVGQKFDPNQHESIASQPSADVPADSVVQVVRVGYTLNGRLLRPASVIVSSGAAAEKGSA
jgi:molecular chaperone GrpE